MDSTDQTSDTMADQTVTVTDQTVTVTDETSDTVADQTVTMADQTSVAMADQTSDTVAETKEDGQVVTPWTVTSKTGIDYMKLIKQFGCKSIEPELLKKFEEVTRMRIHPWLRRGKFFSHKQLEVILDCVKAGKPVGIYTGRGPTSEAMHMGHMLPFKFTKYLQDALGAIVIIQMSDDEKYYFDKAGKPIEYYNDLCRKNARDIIACGFDPNKTFIFSNLETLGGDLYKVSALIAGSTTGNQIKGIFGIGLDNTVGQIMWPVFQSSPAFWQAFPKIFLPDTTILVPMAIDQDPYFRMARDFAAKFASDGYIKPATIHTQFLPGLGGIEGKASSSEKSVPPIFMTDTEEEARLKIKTYAFSGGGQTKKDHIDYGANLEVDVAYQYLVYFLEDDEELKRIATEYRYGRMMTAEIKKIMADKICEILKDHQTKRNEITDETIALFFNPNREFDRTVPVREEIKLHDDSVYKSYGLNFDIYFGLPAFTKDKKLNE
uniref:tryptophan--tRNA ligase n=1 Tax=viral metagenome TaxID=1070528 RepID=A0A6C0ECJ6_9ZZZZ